MQSPERHIGKSKCSNIKIELWLRDVIGLCSFHFFIRCLCNEAFICQHWRIYISLSIECAAFGFRDLKWEERGGHCV